MTIRRPVGILLALLLSSCGAKMGARRDARPAVNTASRPLENVAEKLSPEGSPSIAPDDTEAAAKVAPVPMTLTGMSFWSWNASDKSWTDHALSGPSVDQITVSNDGAHVMGLRTGARTLYHWWFDKRWRSDPFSDLKLSSYASSHDGMHVAGVRADTGHEGELHKWTYLQKWTETPLKVSLGPQLKLARIVMSPDATKIVGISADDRRLLHYWSYRSGSWNDGALPNAGAASIDSLALSGDGRHLFATKVAGNGIMHWTTDGLIWTESALVLANHPPLSSIIVSQDGKDVFGVTSSPRGIYRLSEDGVGAWSAAALAPQETSEIASLHLSANGDQVWAHAVNGQLHQWTRNGNDWSGSEPFSEAGVRAFGLSPAGTHLAVARDAHYVSRVGQKLMRDGKPWRFAGYTEAFMLATRIMGCAGGTALGEGFYENPEIYVERTFKRLGDARINALRLFATQDFLLKSGVVDFALFDLVVQKAKKYDVFLMPTLAIGNGGCTASEKPFPVAWYVEESGKPGSPYFRNGDPSSQNPLPYKEFVRRFLDRYADEDHIAMWILNTEAAIFDLGELVAARALDTFAKETMDMARQIAPHHLFTMGELGSWPGDDPVGGYDYHRYLDLYSIHDYHYLYEGAERDNFPGIGVTSRLKKLMDRAAENDKPIYFDEIGMSKGSKEEWSREAPSEAARLGWQRAQSNAAFCENSGFWNRYDTTSACSDRESCFAVKLAEYAKHPGIAGVLAFAMASEEPGACFEAGYTSRTPPDGRPGGVETYVWDPLDKVLGTFLQNLPHP